MPVIRVSETSSYLLVGDRILPASGAGPVKRRLSYIQVVIALVAGERNMRRPRQFRTAFLNEQARKSYCAGRIFDHPVGLLRHDDGSSGWPDARALHLTKSQETGLDDFGVPVYNNYW